MKARCLGTAVLALALLLAVVPVALAKGASAATIKGPGLDRPISLRGLGEPGADTKLAKLSDQAGLFVAMFGDNGVAGQLAGAPPGDLGPRYTITYAVPGDGGTFTVVQDLYPYAPGGAASRWSGAGSAVRRRCCRCWSRSACPPRRRWPRRWRPRRPPP